MTFYKLNNINLLDKFIDNQYGGANIYEYIKKSLDKNNKYSSELTETRCNKTKLEPQLSCESGKLLRSFIKMELISFNNEAKKQKNKINKRDYLKIIKLIDDKYIIDTEYLKKFFNTIQKKLRRFVSDLEGLEYLINVDIDSLSKILINTIKNTANDVVEAPQEQAPSEQAPQEQAPQEQAPSEQAPTDIQTGGKKHSIYKYGWTIFTAHEHNEETKSALLGAIAIVLAVYDVLKSCASINKTIYINVLNKFCLNTDNEFDNLLKDFTDYVEKKSVIDINTLCFKNINDNCSKKKNLKQILKKLDNVFEEFGKISMDKKFLPIEIK